MHPEAYDWVAKRGDLSAVAVLDIGGRNINGSVRGLFPTAGYASLDIQPGKGVDVVADAATWTPDREYDVAVCCEVFEHTEVWPDICRTAFKALRSGGGFIVTCAGPGRAAHSAVDGGSVLHDGEHYANVPADELEAVLRETGFVDIVADSLACDTRAVCRKP